MGEHRLFGGQPQTPPFVGPPSGRSVQPVEVIEEVPEEIADFTPSRTGGRRDHGRRDRAAPPSHSDPQVVAAVLVCLIVLAVGAYLVMQQDTTTGAMGADSGDQEGAGASSSSETTTPTRESKDAWRARWEAYRKEPPECLLNKEVFNIICEEKEDAAKATIQRVAGRPPDRTQTVGDRRYWYYGCIDGTIQFVWWTKGGLWWYQINDF